MKVKVISLPYIFQVLYVLCFTGPKYQVSVYRTIGPLVFLSIYLSNDQTYIPLGKICVFGRNRNPVYPSLHQSIYLSIYLSFYLSIYLSIHLSIQRSNNNIYPIMENMCIRSKSKHTLSIYLFLAHRSRRLTGELIGYPWIRRPSVVVVRRPSTFSNIFSSETAWPIKSKFYVEPPW